MPAHDIWSILDRYGLPIVMLLILLAAIYKLLWPVLIQQFSVTHKILSDQAEQAQQRLDKSGAEFLKSLERRDAIMEKGFLDIHAKLEEINATMRRRK